MDGLTPEQIDILAQSIYSHISGATGGTGHLNDFGPDKLTLDDLTSRIRDMLNDPDTRFMVNTSNDPGRGGAVTFFNEKTQSVLVFNPNNLQDPHIDEAGKLVSAADGPDNFAGTFYRQPKINADGVPVSFSGRPLNDNQAAKEFRGEFKRLRNKLADATDIPRAEAAERIKAPTLAESSEWAERISAYDESIREGLEKGVRRIQAGEWTHVVNGKGLTKAADIADNVREISRLARVGRLGANITGVGVAIGAGSLLLTGQAHAAQRDYASTLNSQGVLSDEAYETYLELNQDTEQLLYGDLAVSTADPTGISIILTGFAEGKARRDFKDWADEHAPHLSEEQFQTLSMSMFPGNSARADMLWEARRQLPDTIEGQPESLHDAINLNELYKDASRLGYSHKEGYVYGGNLQQTLAQARAMGIEVETSSTNPSTTIRNLKQAIRQELVGEMDSLLSDPENIDFMLSTIPVDDRLEYVRRLAASESDPAAFAENHPEIAAYVTAYDESWTGWFLKEDDPLKENPELLNEYIKERSFPNQGDDATPDPQNQDFSVDGSTYTGSLPVEDVVAAGIPVASDLIPDSIGQGAPLTPEQTVTQTTPHYP